MEYIVIPAVALCASALTFFSGFGLGTLLLPAFAFFYPPEVAVGLTAVVHLLNNLFKISLVFRHIDWKVLLRFGLPAIAGAVLGAWLLSHMSTGHVFHTWGGTHEITLLKLIMAGLMIFFALFELIPALRDAQFPAGWIIPGGFVSGFFGGLSGHQGALRSAFLLRLRLGKEVFIATGVAIAVGIDVSRIGVYAGRFGAVRWEENMALLVVAVLAAFTGAYTGSKLLKKITVRAVQILVSILLFVIAGLLGSGVI